MPVFIFYPMRHMLLIAFLLASLLGNAQFPQTWIGSYSGTMYLSGANGVYDSLNIELHIQPIENSPSWTYKMLYKSARFGESSKNYVILKDSTGYLMDEQNGILIEMMYSNNVFYEFFEVNEMYFACTMRKMEKGILFEIFGTSTSITRETESEPDEKNNVFLVYSRKPQFAQTALLLPIN